MTSTSFRQPLTSALKIDSQERFDLPFLRRLLQAIDVRLKPLQEQQASVDKAISGLNEVALDRINTTLTPAIEQVLLMNERGFLIAQSATEATLVVGDILTFSIADDTERELFTPSPFTALTREGSTDDYAVARTVAYDKVSGDYRCEVLSFVGNAGPHSDWVIGALAGSTAAQYALLEEGKTVREAAVEAAGVAMDNSELSQKWAESPEQPAGADTMSARTAARVSIYSALDAKKSMQSAQANADRIDLGAFDADVAAVEASAEQTALDASATAADRVQTALNVSAAEAARDLTETYAGVDHRASSWSALAAISGTAGQVGYVGPEDIGTHTDPVAGGTVANEGVYEWAGDGLGSAQAERVGSTGLADKAEKSTERALGYAFTAPLVMEADGQSYATVYRKVDEPEVGEQFQARAIVKYSGLPIIRLYSNSNARFEARFNIETEEVVSVTRGTDATITYLGGGRYLLAITSEEGISTTNFNVQLGGSIDGSFPYTGDGTKGFFCESFRTLSLSTGVDEWVTDDVSDAYFTKLGSTVVSGAAPETFLAEELKTLRREKEALAVEVQTLQDAQHPPYDDGSAALDGRKWAALGSSITDQDKYTAPLAAATGMVLQNLGVSGGSFAAGGHYGSQQCYDQIPNIASDTDLVTVEVSPNDFGSRNSTLGALGDTTTATFYGALYATVVGVQAQAPNAKIVFLTPYGADSRFPDYSLTSVNADGNAFFEFQQAARDVANLLGLPCIDVGGEAGFGYLTNDVMTSDGLHQTTASGVVYADYVAAKLRDLAIAGLI